MPIKIPPYTGQILICDYSGFIVPEMVKPRPVIVISPKPRRGIELCAVVPLSTTKPDRIDAHHIPIAMPKHLVDMGWYQPSSWAKCDCVNTVSLQRLDLIRMGRNLEGRRQYSYYVVDKDILKLIRLAVAKCLGIPI